MRARKRIALSFGCLLVSTFLYGLAFNLHSYAAHSFTNILGMVPITLLYAVPGWAVTLPLMVLFKDARGWRGLALFVSCVGSTPALLHLGGFDSLYVISALLVSSFATTFYLVSLATLSRPQIASARGGLRRRST